MYTSFLLNGKINATQNKSHRDVVKVKASEQHFKVMFAMQEMEKKMPVHKIARTNAERNGRRREWKKEWKKTRTSTLYVYKYMCV